MDHGGRLVNAHERGEARHLAVAARTVGGETVVYMDEELPDSILNADVSRLFGAFPNVEPFVKLLYAHGMKPQLGHFKTYTLRRYHIQGRSVDVERLPSDDPRVRDFGFDKFRKPVFAVERDGVIASACVSVRQDADSAECWVSTAAEHRRGGLAGRVVLAWARACLDAGIVPFYSHAIENIPSAGLAEKLELEPLFEEIVVVEGG